MDINESLENFEDVINILRLIPKIESVDIPKNKYVSNNYMKKVKEDTLKKCISILQKIKCELNDEISKLVFEDNENIEEKYQIINKRYANSISEIEKNKEKYNLIHEIEEYEKMGNKRCYKIIFNKNETNKLIKNIHEIKLKDNKINEENKKIIEDNVNLDYEKIGIVETDTLRRILNSLNNF